MQSVHFIPKPALVLSRPLDSGTLLTFLNATLDSFGIHSYYVSFLVRSIDHGMPEKVISSLTEWFLCALLTIVFVAVIRIEWCTLVHFVTWYSTFNTMMPFNREKKYQCSMHSIYASCIHLGFVRGLKFEITSLLITNIMQF